MTDERQTKRIKRPYLGGRRRVAILMLAALTALLIRLPGSAPYVAIAASVVMVWGIWARPSDKAADAPADQSREPSLWDDGFGQTG